MLKQLCRERPSLPDQVKVIYDQHKTKQTRPSFEEISQSLLSVAATYSRVFIVVDALDECQVSEGCRERFIKETLNLQALSGANVFATSRFIPEIIAKFEGSLSLEIHAKEEDLRLYLNGHMDRLPGFIKNNLELKDDIKTRIIQAVDGVLVVFSIDAIKH